MNRRKQAILETIERLVEQGTEPTAVIKVKKSPAPEASQNTSVADKVMKQALGNNKEEAVS